MAFQQEAAFRANFVINLLNTALNFIVGIAGVAILFSQVETIQGWTFSQTLALLGIYLLVGALRDLCIGPSLDTLGGMDGDVWQGRFDFTLLKPVHTQFLVSVRHWRLWAVFDLILSLFILGKALVELGGQLSLFNLAAFLLALMVSVTIVYAILLLLVSGVFWYQGVPLIWIFGTVIQMGRYPVGIYPGWLKTMLTWIVPVGFITTVPVEALTGQASATILIGGIVLAVSLLLAASSFFRLSLRHYTSASS
jgi:ABC-2 type transport system permease protein